MNALLEKLYQGQSLTRSESHSIFADIFAGKLDAVQLSSLLTALKIKGESAEEIAGAASAMLEAARPFPKPQVEVGEIVGTGGDGLNTINISTISAIVAAASGLHIAKHGNRAVSSKTGASDLLLALGYKIDAEPEVSAKVLKDEGFAFIFAQKYHQAMRFAAPVRKSLATRTIFNLLGPLTNPAHPDYELMGVYDPKLLHLAAEVLKLTGVKRALCVNGCGMDEIAPFGTTQYSELHADGTITDGTLSPADFGIEGSFTQQDLNGGLPEENAKTALNILNGHGTEAQNAAISANAGSLLYLAGKAASLKEGYAKAYACLKSGAGAAKLKAIVAAIGA